VRAAHSALKRRSDCAAPPENGRVREDRPQRTRRGARDRGGGRRRRGRAAGRRAAAVGATRALSALRQQASRWLQ
jgi:hypothetical protein